MSYQVLLNSLDISSLVVSYKRTQAICDGIGRITLTIADTINTKPWDEIVVYENSTKVGTYFISSVTENEIAGSKTIEGQDGSKKLTDYFLDSKITPKNVIKYSREMIVDVLSDAGVSYSFNVSGNGAPIAPETQLGAQSAYDAVLLLCQQSGWYFYFDKNNICRIGKLRASLSNIKYTFTDENTLEFSYNYNDNSLRNKAIVWGGYDTVNKKPIFFSKRIFTPWDRHKKDIRPVVLSNGAIHSINTAKYLGNLLLETFSKLNKEKKISAPGFLDINIGDVVKVNLSFFKSTSLVTDLEVNVDSSGVKTNLVLDKRCPRLFAWFEWGTNPDFNDYVYVGTQGAGVKRKPIGKSGWYDFSSGLDNLIVKDLRIYADNFICVADDGYAYIRTETTSWRKLNHGSFTDGIVEYPENKVKAVSCSIDQVTNDFYVGYNYYEENTDFNTFRSWVAQFDSTGKLKNKFLVGLYFTNRLLIHDLDRHSVNTFIAGIGDISDFNKIGVRDVYPINAPEETLPFIYGPQLLSTSGGIITDKYQENELYIPPYSGAILAYSGAFLSGTRGDVCSFVKEFDWASCHSLYDNGKIFTLSRHEAWGLSIFDFTPSGVTTLTGLPIKHSPLISGILPPLYGDRFLYLEKKPTHPELHYISIDAGLWDLSFNQKEGNCIFHGKYIFTDYTYTTLSGTELLKNNEILVSTDIFDSEMRDSIRFNYCFNKSSGKSPRKVFFDNGIVLVPISVEYIFYIGGNPNPYYALESYILRYNVKTQEKRIQPAYGVTSQYDTHNLFVSPIIKLPNTNSAIFGVNFWWLAKHEIQDGNCQILANFPFATSALMRVRLDDGFYEYDEIYKAGGEISNVENPFCYILHKTSINATSGGSCKRKEEGNGNVVWLLGSNISTENNDIISRGHVLDEKGTSIIDVYLEFAYQHFYYIPWVDNPCCFRPEESQPPAWVNKIATAIGRFYIDKDTIRPLNIIHPPERISAPLTVPSGYYPSYIGAQKITRGYNFYIGKINPYTGGEERIPIPVFYEWDIDSVIPHVCPYIDFFDDTIYVFVPNRANGTLYGIDYQTGILKKLITGFNYDIFFGEKWDFVPPVIHNGILFRRSAFWVFRTTVTGYFVFPVLYQNYYGNTHLVNVELLPINVEVSKTFPYITYNPFEYWLPNVSGSLVPFSGSIGTKIYTIDFTSYLQTSLTGNDERVVDIMEIPYIASGIVESGIINIDKMRYVAIPQEKSLYIQDVELDNSPAILKYSQDLIYHVETSNIPPTPFVFINDLDRFYEFDKEVWRIYSNPPAKILTIRLDDLL